MFKKYPSIERLENLEKRLDKYHPDFDKNEALVWCVTEKLHGSNICVTIKGDEINVYSRNGHKVSENIEMVVLNRLKDFKLQNNVSAIVYGEIIGPGIQKGVDYGKEKEFYFIECYFTNEATGFKAHYPAYILKNYLKEHKCEHIVPLIKHCSCSFNSIKRWTKHFLFTDPKTDVCKESESIIEGVVCEATSFESDIKLKFKLHHPTFSQRKSCKKVRNAMEKIIADADKTIVEEYLTEARVESAISKWPEYTKLQIKDVFQELVLDVKKELESDNLEWDKRYSKIISGYAKEKIIMNAKQEF